MHPYILYGMPASLYTGKVRCYLRKQRIAFEERTHLGRDPHPGLRMKQEARCAWRRVVRHHHLEVGGPAAARYAAAGGPEA